MEDGDRSEWYNVRKIQLAVVAFQYGRGPQNTEYGSFQNQKRKNTTTTTKQKQETESLPRLAALLTSLR